MGRGEGMFRLYLCRTCALLMSCAVDEYPVS